MDAVTLEKDDDARRFDLAGFSPLEYLSWSIWADTVSGTHRIEYSFYWLDQYSPHLWPR